MTENAVIFVRMLPRDIHYLNRIFEGYEYLGVVSTINKQQGIVAIRATPDTIPEVRKVLANLTIHLEYIKIT